MNNILGTRLKELRLKNDKLQKDVANYLNISDVAYGYYEKGERQPNPDMLLKLAKYFNVTTDYLLGKTDIPNELHMAASSDIDLAKLAKLDKDKQKTITDNINNMINMFYDEFGKKDK